METVWHGEITPRNPREAMELPLDTTRAPLRLQKGEEMGRFNMGSTVILITAPDMADWLSNMKAGDTVSVGQPLARLRGRMMAAHG
jgi:phosphatidylserine decarboxylase